jgi:hypothetical protein
VKLSISECAKFLSRKFAPDTTIEGDLPFTVIEDSKIVAAYGVLKQEYVSNEITSDCGLVCDVFTHPDFQKRGLFKKVSTAAINFQQSQGVDFLIGFPIRDHVMPGHKAVGWIEAFKMHLWWRSPLIPFRGLAVEKYSFNSKVPLVINPSPAQPLRLNLSPKWVQERFSRLEAEYLICSIPNSSDAVVFRKTSLRGLPVVAIVHLQSTSSQSTRALIRAVRMEAMKKRCLAVVGCWNDSFASELFLDQGTLIKSSRYQTVILRSLNAADFSYEEADYRLSWLDSDTL